MRQDNELLRAAQGTGPIDRVMVAALIVWIGVLIGVSSFGNP
ncbi:hypothetical protein [Burkholderia multivorans]|nr:hypothetical protein [Burkholderia multivorans]MDN7510951.1 hypothetical protein [Burkholderia multivorans]ULR75094.1 hypothetical protein JC1_22 [Burkholderia phage JC1]